MYPRLLGISLTFTLFLFLDTLVNRFAMHIECGTVVYYLQIHISVVWCCIIYLIMLFITRKDIITVFEWALQEFSFVAACRRIVKKIKFVSTSPPILDKVRLTKHNFLHKIAWRGCQLNKIELFFWKTLYGTNTLR